MQTQRTVTISSPTLREDYIQMAPHFFAPTVLDKTPSERTCPSRGARGSEGPTRGRSQKSLEDVRKVASTTPPHELYTYRSYADLAAPFKKDVTITNQSLAVSMVSLRDLGSTIPGGPVSSVHWSALLRRTSQTQDTWSAWRGAAQCQQ